MNLNRTTKIFSLALAMTCGFALSTMAQTDESTTDTTVIEMVEPAANDGQGDQTMPVETVTTEVAPVENADGSMEITTTTKTTISPMDESSSSGSKKTFKGLGRYKSTIVGVTGGAMALNVPFSIPDFRRNDAKFAYGAFVDQYLSHTFAIHAEFSLTSTDLTGHSLRGDLQAYNLLNRNAYPELYPSDYHAKLYEYSIGLLANVANMSFMRKKNVIGLYATAGVGVVNFQSYVTSEVNGNTYRTYKLDNYTNELVFPVGIGAKIRLTNDLTASIGYQARFTDTEKLDGFYANDNVDKYSYGFAGLSYAIGKQGKPNIEWSNPVANMYDDIVNGEVRPLRKKMSDLSSRLDTINQYLATQYDSLHNDADGDGVVDMFDKQANTPTGAMVDPSGRALDSDGDGVIDLNDRCPFEKGLAIYDGCKTAALKVNTEEQELLNEIHSCVLFKTGSTVVKSRCNKLIKRLAKSVKAHPNWTVDITGYTDTDGGDNVNDPLSIRRARAVKVLLVKYGVAGSRVNAEGIGSKNPLVPNTSEENKQINRTVRIEIRG